MIASSVFQHLANSDNRCNLRSESRARMVVFGPDTPRSIWIWYIIHAFQVFRQSPTRPQKVQRYLHYPTHISMPRNETRGSRFKQPLLDSTLPRVLPNATKPPGVLLNSIQCWPPRAHHHVRDASLASAPPNDLADLIQCRLSSVKPFSRGSLRRRITRELGDGRHRCRRETPARSGP